jgi:hypothetical protein
MINFIFIFCINIINIVIYKLFFPYLDKERYEYIDTLLINKISLLLLLLLLNSIHNPR